jgi:acyl-CoA synthetase (AMP-forming)/AMP-acid ligase II
MLQLPNIIELACSYLAIARIGAIANPLSVMHRTYELRHAIGMTEPKAYITTTNYAGFNFVEMLLGIKEEFPCLKSIIAIGDNLPQNVVPFQDLISKNEGSHNLVKYLEANNITANDIFTICWTSGTEAEPKGVPRSSNQWIAAARFVLEAAELEPRCNILSPFPFINLGSIVVFIHWLLTGGKLCLHHPFNLPVFLGQIKEEQIQFTVLPPAVLNMLLQNKTLLESIDFRTIKSIGSGSAPLSDWMVKGFQERGVHIINIFGSNEGMCLISGPQDFPDPSDRAKYFPRWGVEGFKWRIPVAGTMKTKLIDARGHAITEPGIPGEMCVKGAAVFSGYYKRPDLTEKSFDAEGYFMTGDQFSIEGRDGNLDRYLFSGRTKDLIIRGGVNIAPEELESLILAHPKVAEVAVIGYPDAKLGERICAVVVPVKGEAIILNDLVGFFIEKGVAIYKRPEKLLVVESMPKNSLGKILKRELRKRVVQ